MKPGNRAGRWTIRRAEAADAERLAQLAVRTFRDTYAATTSPADLESHTDASFGAARQRLEIESPDILTLIAERDGQAIAYAQLRRGQAPACVAAETSVELWRLYVDRPAMGSGVARDLVDAACSEALALAAGALWLGVWERNPRAIAFYRKSGFREAGTQTFRLGNQAQTDLIFVLDLAASR